jgi:hypothetical protein
MEEKGEGAGEREREVGEEGVKDKMKQQCC